MVLAAVQSDIVLAADLKSNSYELRVSSWRATFSKQQGVKRAASRPAEN